MEAILYIGISQTIFAGILIALKKPRMMANQTLAAWLFMIGIEMVIVLINQNLIDLYHIKIIPFVYGPLLLLYTKLLTSESPVFNVKFLWHFLPFFVFLTISLIFIDMPVMSGTEGFLLADRFISFRIIYAVSFFLSITTYSILTFIVINKHQRQLKKYLSYSSGKVTLQWLMGLSITFYVGYILMFIFGGVDIMMRFMPFDPYEISFIGLTIVAFLFGVFGFNQSSIFEVVIRTKIITDPEKQIVSTEKKYQRSGLKKKNINIYIDKINAYMEEDKPYLDRELNIYTVSEALNIPRHIISEIINEHMGKNFYTLINEYRVEEVKERLQDSKYKHLTILAIAYDSGFNSKSSFNTIFKERTGMTPSQYVNQSISRDS